MRRASPGRSTSLFDALASVCVLGDVLVQIG